jgi:EAL domain-containing protein (putative c-di-GMP-specific phosphodiesterase class I)
MGVRLSIDDFGTGYSSLAYLRKMPIDVLKIDQSFVRDITVDKGDAAICEAIVRMSSTLGIGVIAEGVETVEQLRILNAMDCMCIQGYLVSKPVPPRDVEAYLDESWLFKYAR